MKIRTVEILFIFNMGVSDVFIFIRSASIGDQSKFRCVTRCCVFYDILNIIKKTKPMVQYGGILFRCSGPKSLLHRIMVANGFVFEIR